MDAWPTGEPSPTLAAAAAPARGDDEPELRPLDPRVRRLWWWTGGLALAVVVLILAVADILISHPLPRGLVTITVLVIGGVATAVVPVIRYRRWRYALRPHDLWIRRGVLTVSTSVIPYRRLQFVDTHQGPLDRLFGLAQLIVHTAAIGTSGRLPGLDAAEAEQLRETLAGLEPDDAGV